MKRVQRWLWIGVGWLGGTITALLGVWASYKDVSEADVRFADARFVTFQPRATTWTLSAYIVNSGKDKAEDLAVYVITKAKDGRLYEHTKREAAWPPEQQIDVDMVMNAEPNGVVACVVYDGFLWARETRLLMGRVAIDHFSFPGGSGPLKYVKDETSWYPWQDPLGGCAAEARQVADALARDIERRR